MQRRKYSIIDKHGLKNIEGLHLDAQHGPWEQQENEAHAAQVFKVTRGFSLLGWSGLHTCPFLIVALNCTTIFWTNTGKLEFLRKSLCECVAAWGGPYLSEYWGRTIEKSYSLWA